MAKRRQRQKLYHSFIELEEKEIELYDKLKERRGNRVGNSKLAELLGLDFNDKDKKRRFFEIRNVLVKYFLVSRVGGGGGGSTELLRELKRNHVKIISNLPEDGTSVSNTAVMERTRLYGDDYWGIRQLLIEEDYVQVGTGRGGTVGLTDKGIEFRRIIKDKRKTEEGAREYPLAVGSEQELYEPLKEYLEKSHKDKDENGEFFACINTARRRRRGSWTNPDLTSITVKRYPLIPGLFFTVTTYEIKRWRDCQDLASVYEAAAHAKYGHYSYLVYESFEGLELPDNIIREVKLLNVGLIRMTAKRRGRGVRFQINYEYEPERNETKPEECNRFLEYVLSDNNDLYQKLRGALGN